tara:strand:+ start:12010 stop:12450 length:441 start_codon:yes stop_codon:yes gene_type:complete
MTLLIAHRGNYNGHSLDENKPEYINSVLEKFDCEIDVWLVNNVLYLGHDKPSYQIEKNWLLDRSNKLWCHAKNFDALNFLLNYKELNCFWHQEDDYTITSKGFVWAYPGFYGSKDRTIAVKPTTDMNLNSFYGICSDNFLEINYGS